MITLKSSSPTSECVDLAEMKFLSSYSPHFLCFQLLFSQTKSVTSTKFCSFQGQIINNKGSFSKEKKPKKFFQLVFAQTKPVTITKMCSFQGEIINNKGNFFKENNPQQGFSTTNPPKFKLLHPPRNINFKEQNRRNPLN